MRVLHLSYVLGCNPFCTFFNEIRYYLLEKMLFISEFNIQKLCTCRGGKAIAVVYFRAGYTPDDYPSESVSCFALFSCCSESHLFMFAIKSGKGYLTVYGCTP